MAHALVAAIALLFKNFIMIRFIYLLINYVTFIKLYYFFCY